MPSKKSDAPESSADPATFDKLLEIAAKRGVSEFTAGQYSVKFSQGVAEEWRRVNRPVVER